MVQVPSSVAGWVRLGTLSQCGWWFREESVSLAPTGDSWWLCQQTSFPSTQETCRAFCLPLDLSLSGQQGVGGWVQE